MQVQLNGLYLTRNARQVGIVRDRGAGKVWRWVTTLGYYVTCDGHAAYVGESSRDLVRDVTPNQCQIDAVDSIIGGLDEA